jgi:hypothetical protein
VPWPYVEAVFLEWLRECRLVEEGVGGVGEAALEEVLVDDGVELVGPQHDRHYKLILYDQFIGTHAKGRINIEKLGDRFLLLTARKGIPSKILIWIILTATQIWTVLNFPNLLTPTNPHHQTNDYISERRMALKRPSSAEFSLLPLWTVSRLARTYTLWSCAFLPQAGLISKIISSYQPPIQSCPASYDTSQQVFPT